MVEIIRKLETAVSWSVHQNEEKLSQLEREIYSGQDWDDLSAVLDAVEVTYQEGKISRSKAEGLAAQAKARGQRLPEKDAAKVPGVFLGEDLSNPAANSCPSCGKAEWWGNTGRPVCAICHPHPEMSGEGRATA